MNRTPLWLRWMGLLVGGIALIWLPIEDQNIWITNWISAILLSWLATYLVLQQRSSVSFRLKLVIGAIAGLLVTPVSFLLIIFKSGLHAHGFTEFSIHQLLNNLQNSLWWLLLGILVPALLSLVALQNNKRE